MSILNLLTRPKKRKKSSRKRRIKSSHGRTKKRNLNKWSISERNKKFDKLYLMERVSSKSLTSRIFGLYEVKIGVTSKTVKSRNKSIDEDLDGDVVISRQLYLPKEAYFYEQKLLDKYIDKSWNPQGGSSAGNSEWLRCGWLTMIFIHVDYWAIDNKEKISAFYIIIILSIFVMSIFYSEIKNIINLFYD